MGFNFSPLKSKISVDKRDTGTDYQNKKLAKPSESFGLKQGRGISLPKGNSPINK